MVNVSQFLTKYLRELEEGNAAVFIGAGMSVSAGYVDWAKLLSPLAREIGLDIDRETDFVSLAQFYVNAKGGRGSINQQIIDMVPALPRPSENHNLLARLPLETYWTTNYDQLIETALRNAGRVPDVKYTVEQLATTKRNRDAATRSRQQTKEKKNRLEGENKILADRVAELQQEHEELQRQYMAKFGHRKEFA